MSEVQDVVTALNREEMSGSFFRTVDQHIQLDIESARALLRYYKNVTAALNEVKEIIDGN